MYTRDHTTTVTLCGFTSSVWIRKMVGRQARIEEVLFLLSVKVFNIESEDIGFQQCHWPCFWLHRLFTLHVPCKSPRTRQSELLRQHTDSYSFLCLLLLRKLGINYNRRCVNGYSPEPVVPTSSPQQTSRHFILLYSKVTFSVFQLTALYDVNPQKFWMCF